MVKKIIINKTCMFIVNRIFLRVYVNILETRFLEVKLYNLEIIFHLLMIARKQTLCPECWL